MCDLIYVKHLYSSFPQFFADSKRLAAGVPDPFLGPKEVRLLLVCRGFVGKVLISDRSIATNSPGSTFRFFGLFGVYYSLQYLSLSDATVLTFLAPICTAVAGSLLLGENFTRREALAGSECLIFLISVYNHTPDCRPLSCKSYRGYSHRKTDCSLWLIFPCSNIDAQS